MEHFLKLLAQHWGMSQSQYWHLRLLSAISLLPLLGVLYLIFFGKRELRKPSAPASSEPSMWVSSEGQLLIRRADAALGKPPKPRE